MPRVCISDNNRKCTSCIAGTKWNGSTCENCPSGSFSNTANATNCTQCPKGSYQDETGKTSCKSCNGINQYQDALGQTVCKTCSTNSTPNSTHTGCDSKCQTASDCRENQYLKDSCICTDCTAGCMKCTDVSCIECKDDHYRVNTNTCEPDPCIKYNAIFVKAGKTKFCMKKYNAGDENTSDLIGISTGQQQKGGTNAAGGHGWVTFPDNELHCWQAGGTDACYPYDNTKPNNCATTADPTSCTTQDKLSSITPTDLGLTWDYNGCTRTVCNWWAANTICAVNLSKNGQKWHLPTPIQQDALRSQYKNNSEYRRNVRLQLCNWNIAGYGFPVASCHTGSNLCRGSYNGYCYPHELWGSSSSSNGHQVSVYDYNISWIEFDLSHARSVRCVMDIP